MHKEPRLTSGAWGPAGSALLPLRPGMDEAAVEGHGVLRGDALGVSKCLKVSLQTC